MKDITTRKDVELLVDSFYKKVVVDKTIAHFFNDVIKLDWEKHMPIMYDFWETSLLHKAVYKGNPMKKHLDLNALSPIKEEHFDQWLKLFNETVDELFSGQTATTAKSRALSIATVIKIKLLQSFQG